MRRSRPSAIASLSFPCAAGNDTCAGSDLQLDAGLAASCARPAPRIEATCSEDEEDCFVMGGVASDGYNTDDTDELMARAAGADLLGPWVPRRPAPRDPTSGQPEPTVTALASQAVAGGAADWMFAFSRGGNEGLGTAPGAGEAAAPGPMSSDVVRTGPPLPAVHPMLSTGVVHPMMSMAASSATPAAPAPGSSGFKFANRLPEIQPDFKLTYM